MILRAIKTIPWDDFVHADLSKSLDAGDAWIIKGAFSAEFMALIRDRAIAWAADKPSSFHKMLDGVPDFHRVITPEIGENYSIHGCKHSYYFFRWNSDPLGIWPEITKRWRVIKEKIGLRPDEYENNKPSDGPVDRIQVVRYPPSIGYLEPHIDAPEHQKVFISGYMSKRGKDYEGGGFYFVKDGEAVYAEEMIDVGDLCIGHANLYHGVAPCDREKTPSWDASDGRWFLGLYSNASDYEKKRNTASPVKIDIPGVRP